MTKPTKTANQHDAPEVDTCSACRFFERRRTPFQGVDNGFCRRNPAPVQTEAHAWCGEHREGQFKQKELAR